MNSKTHEVLEAITLAGGKIVGKTRLQKSVFILELAGIGFGFSFSYYHYGPYSEELASSVKDAITDGVVVEREDRARWGGVYSVFTAANVEDLPHTSVNDARKALLEKMMTADSVALELAATAALLKNEGHADWWAETRRLKPLKANDEMVSEAMNVWESLRKVGTPSPLPSLENS